MLQQEYKKSHILLRRFLDEYTQCLSLLFSLNGLLVGVQFSNENSKKFSEAITPILNTVKLCASKYSIERSQEQCKNGLEVGLELIILTLEIL